MKKILLTLAIIFIASVIGVSAVVIVQPGDTLTKIAEKYNLTLRELLNKNPDIVNPDLIYPDQEIVIDEQLTENQLVNITKSITFFTKLNQINAELGIFGAVNFVQVQDQALAGSGITSSVTTISLQTFDFPSGLDVVMADFGDIGFGTLEPNTPREENISFTGITQNSDDTADLTGVLRGLGLSAPYTASTSLQFPHAGATLFRITNSAPFYNELLVKRNDETITGLITYNRLPLFAFADLPTTSNQLATKLYVDNVGAGGFTAVNIGDGKTLRANGTIPESMDINTTTNSWFFIDSKGFFQINSSTPSLMTVFWDDRWIATSTADGMLFASTTLAGKTSLTGKTTTTDSFHFDVEPTGSGIPYFGNGQDGALTVSSEKKFNTASSTLDLLTSAGQRVINVTDATQFTTSTKVFLHQTRGTGAGLWEIVSIVSKDNDAGTFTVKNDLVNDYQSTFAQAIEIPQYTEVAFKTGATFSTANEWRGETGGIIIFYADEGVIIEDDVTLEMDGYGFRGGLGNGVNTGFQGEGTGGAGVSSISANGNGGGGGGSSSAVGIGGLKFMDLSSDYFSKGIRMNLGGGGGGGISDDGTPAVGGDGGGILIIITPQFINVGGTIQSKGLDGGDSTGTNAGGAGGGAGGVLAFFNITGSTNETGSVIAGTGGSGAGGVSVNGAGAGGGNRLTGSNGGQDTGGTGSVGSQFFHWIFGILPSS